MNKLISKISGTVIRGEDDFHFSLWISKLSVKSNAALSRQVRILQKKNTQLT